MTAALARAPQTHIPARVVLRPAPRREPPFDDELDAPSTGPLDRRLPFELVGPTRTTWRPADLRRDNQPDPALWARRLLVGMIETAAGRRPLRQLAAFFSPSVQHGIGHELDRANLDGAPHWLHRATIRAVRASEPSEGVAELCAVLDCGPRARAIAMRVEVHRGRWCCTRLQIG